jgi:hypothetical protein
MFELDGESTIEQALLDAYPDAEPVCFSVPEPGGHELAGCIAIRREEPVPHWVVVSRGFSELGEKTGDDPEVSGWGFELTCRLPARSEEPDFGWVVSWMENVAQHLNEQVSVIDTCHHMPMWQTADEDELAAVVFVEEPVIEPTRSRNGNVTFLQMVGLTNGEYEALQAWDPASLIELVRARDPLLLTDAARASYMRQPDFARAVAEGHARDGSSTAILHRVPILWSAGPDGIEVHLSVEAVGLVKWAIGARLAHGNPMFLYGERRRMVRPDGSLAVSSQLNVALRPEKGISEIDESDDGGKLCVLRLSVDARAELAAMPEEPGVYTFTSLKGVKLVVARRQRIRQPSYPGL